MILPSKLSTQLKTKSTLQLFKFPCLKFKQEIINYTTKTIYNIYNKTYKKLLDSINKNFEIVNRCNINIVNFKFNIWIYMTKL